MTGLYEEVAKRQNPELPSRGYAQYLLLVPFGGFRSEGCIAIYKESLSCILGFFLTQIKRFGVFWEVRVEEVSDDSNRKTDDAADDE